MAFTVSASNEHGGIKLERKTAREAFDLAKSYRHRGYSGILVVDTQSGERFSEVDIETGRLPEESEGTDMVVKPALKRKK